MSSRTARRKQSASSHAATRDQKNGVGTISAEEFDRRVDNGEDVSAYLDYSQATRPGRDTFKVNVDFTVDLLRRIDAEAARFGIARQAWIKLRLTDLLDATDAARRNAMTGTDRS